MGSSPVRKLLHHSCFTDGETAAQIKQRIPGYTAGILGRFKQDLLPRVVSPALHLTSALTSKEDRFTEKATGGKQWIPRAGVTPRCAPRARPQTRPPPTPTGARPSLDLGPALQCPPLYRPVRGTPGPPPRPPPGHLRPFRRGRVANSLPPTPSPRVSVPHAQVQFRVSSKLSRRTAWARTSPLWFPGQQLRDRGLLGVGGVRQRKARGQRRLRGRTRLAFGGDLGDADRMPPRPPPLRPSRVPPPAPRPPRPPGALPSALPSAQLPAPAPGPAPRPSSPACSRPRRALPQLSP